MIKAVIFDLDDTLYSYQSLHTQAMEYLMEFTCSKLPVSELDFQEAFKRARQETKKTLRYTASEHNRMIYFQKTLEYLNHSPIGLCLEMYQIYWDFILNNMRLADGAEDLLKKLKSLQIKIGVCSDLTVYIQHRKLKHLGLTPYVDALVTSEEAGAEKPAQIMFQLILNKLKVNAQETIYIGDSYDKDVKGSERAGMKSIWYTEEEYPYFERKAKSMKEIGDIINDLQQN